jgi:hypothetical protein
VYSTAIQGYNLVEAANLTEARSPSGERNWESMKAAFKEWKTTADSAIKAVTWAHSYEPVISDALKLTNST